MPVAVGPGGLLGMLVGWWSEGVCGEFTLMDPRRTLVCFREGDEDGLLLPPQNLLTCVPVGPVGPVEPTRPVAPLGPEGPWGPWGPLGPIEPVASVAPVAPVAPVGPVGPVEPVLPCRPY